TFTNGPSLEFIRCFLVGSPEVVRHPEHGGLTFNLGPEAPLTPVGPPRADSLVRAEVQLPDDQAVVTLAFEVGWARGGRAPSQEESWGCSPFRIRLAAPGDPEPEPDPGE